MSNTITRTDIATAAEVSQRTVERKEKAWGLDKCRSHAVEKPAVYFRDKVNIRLLRLGVISKPI